MAVASRGKQWKERETSPERTKVWTEPKPAEKRKVPVVYYLSRNGHLEHPHFMEVSLSSSDGLYLRDVINRLNFLRGKGMASMYSWSSKRSYKNGFVWHDLSEDDFIYPAHGHEYVLKGSELPHLINSSSSPRSQDTASSSSSSASSDKALDVIPSKPLADGLPRRKKTPWNSLDLTEYKVYKTDLTAEATLKAADASTQTDDRRQRRRPKQENESRDEVPVAENPTTELERDEISPPPSSSSPETLESLIKADGRLIAIDRDRTAGNSYPSGRMRASAVLMHLISCGSMSVKDHGLSLASQYRGRLPRGGVDQEEGKETDGLIENPCFSALRLEDKEYFSGSLIETKKKGRGDGAAELPGLKRSSSYNADRSSELELELVEKEGEGVGNKCIPRKHKAAAISRSAHGNGSKRITDEPPPQKQ